MANSDPPRQILAICELLEICGADTTPDWAAVEARDYERVVDWIYRILDTLDNKTSHLLSHMSLIVAAQSIFVGIAATKNFSNTSFWLILIFLAVPLLGTVFAVSVFSIEWPFLDWRGTREHLRPRHQSLHEECLALAAVCDRRVCAHQTVRRFAFASSATVVLSVVVIAKELA